MIRFFSEDIPFVLKQKRKIKKWITFVCEKENKSAGDLNFIFCNDRYLLQLNQEYLNHNTLTDIITFDFSDGQDKLTGDIYISVERVKENAKLLGVPFETELHRVIIHGILHLTGYNDKTGAEKIIMREKEDYCLSLLSEME